jgi:hypothetical protein
MFRDKKSAELDRRRGNMQLIKKYKFIQIVLAEQMHGDKVVPYIYDGKPLYHILNNKNQGFLGWITYYKPWKQYVFTGTEKAVFNNACLKDIIDFMDNHAGKE